jgi:tRNA pseudouridine55 synthase
VTRPPAGLLLLDKPVGLSSNAALQRVRWLGGGIKAGHCGSLDPLASGMLPICLGEATRLAGELLVGRKAYRFMLKLGERTATGDAEGDVIEHCAVPALGTDIVNAALARFLGAQTQVPPMYSALKREGTPLYRLARAGISVPREARAITIERLELCAIEADRLDLRVLCSKGTYVRVLGEEIAASLGSCGHLVSLRREYVEPFADEPMVSLEQLEAASGATGEGVAHWPLLHADRAVAHLSPLRLGAAEALALRCGKVVMLAAAGSQPAPEGRWRLYDEEGGFLGLGVSSSAGELRVQRLFSAPLPV